MIIIGEDMVNTAYEGAVDADHTNQIAQVTERLSRRRRCLGADALMSCCSLLMRFSGAAPP